MTVLASFNNEWHVASSLHHLDLDYTLGSRDEAILLFFLPIFLSGNSFFLTYYAQYFARSCNILLKVWLYS